ncbi:hypothetical protein CNMCM6936_005058 [Aspergillus lentulus]|nr:hypothetical protein CNMCM6936_005058 [Aspergillus lentulus]GFF64719.1 hypothetical protein IFM62136_06051 [Aspergillus lentulus]GFF87199.1 hypothetical protein IFM47457_07413 [Aspergillus lentulus]GFG11931.1 hypothetical protein IFM61392_07152 [Aspergillus lentulus]
MADVLAVAGLAYPIAKDLLKLAKKLARLHRQVRNAKIDLTSVIKRTTSVARTYDFFRDTMKVARKIQELASMFNRHQQLMESIDEESIRTIRRLKHITSKFRSLIDGEPISTVDRWIAQFEWSRVSRKTVPSLFQDMEVLERSMRTIGTLVHIQLLSQIQQRDGSDVVVAQLGSFQKMLGIEFDKLQQAQRVQKTLMMQQQTSLGQHLEARDFAQKIMQILEKEIPRLKIQQPAEGQSMSNLRSPPTSPISNKPSPITTRSPPTPSSSGSQTSVSKLQQDEDVSSPGKQIPRQRSTQSAPSRIPSRSSPPSLFLSDGGSDSHDDLGTKSETPYQNAGQDQGGAYMQMPPFGPPKLVARTNIPCIEVALIHLEDGGTTAKYLNMATEVR